MSEPRFLVRPAEHADVPVLVSLLESYMRETYSAAWHGSAEALRRDAFGRACHVHVAVRRDASVVGLLVWTDSYDLHHCVPGGDILDLYVLPEARSQGIAPALVCAVAHTLRGSGGAYLKGGAVQTGSAQRLYGRIAVCHPDAQCIVSGRAFRRLAELAGRPPREALHSLPEKSWNYEA